MSDKKSGSFLGEVLKTLAYALVIAFALRTFLFQPFHIPSASMEPTLYQGDYIITTKYSLGYGKYSASPFKLPIKQGRIFEKLPVRGDVIVFKPEGSGVHFIKRLIGLPGDEIQMVDGFLHINGAKQQAEKVADDTQTDIIGNLIRAQKYKETLIDSRGSHIVFDKQIGSEADNTGIFAVPAGHYFFMGDNRDHSADSRIPPHQGGIGYVAAENLVGRAEFILLSVDDQFKLVKPWTWGHLRGDRFFKGLR
jgi:signal peptidase I